MKKPAELFQPFDIIELNGKMYEVVNILNGEHKYHRFPLERATNAMGIQTNQGAIDITQGTYAYVKLVNDETNTHTRMYLTGAKLIKRIDLAEAVRLAQENRKEYLGKLKSPAT